MACCQPGGSVGTLVPANLPNATIRLPAVGGAGKVAVTPAPLATGEVATCTRLIGAGGSG